MIIGAELHLPTRQGRQVRVVSRLPRGRTSSVFAAIDASDQRRYVLKVAHDDELPLVREAEAIDELESAGYRTRPVLDKGRLTIDGTPRAFLLLAWVEGERSASAESCHLLGRRLAELHDVPVSHTMHSSATLSVKRRCSETVAEVLPYLDARMRRALQELTPRASSVCWNHGDPSLDNFIDGAGGGTLIDFGNAVIAPAAADLARLCVTLQLNEADSAPAIRAALDGYRERAGFLPHDMGYWAVLAAGGIAVWRARQPPNTAPSSAEALRMMTEAITDGWSWC